MTTSTAATVVKVDVPCLHCGTPGGDPVWSGREHEYDNTTDEEFTFVRCRECGLVRLDPRPDVSELGRIYPPNYYAYDLVSEGSGNGEPSLLDRIKMRYYDRRVRRIVDSVGKEGTVRILDVGCADGRLLDWYKASSIGDRLETHGIEMSEKAASVARERGHRVVTGRFEVDTELEPGTFDLIFASHVIEHVDDTRRFAQRAADLLAPGGKFIAATPNIDSFDARRFRRYWGGNHWPRHWTLYEPRTMEWLANSVGLELEHVEYQPNPIFWVWSCHSWLKGRFPRAKWPDRLFPTVRIFHTSLQSFVLLSVFTTVELVVRALSGRTGSMSVELRKPAQAP